MPPPSRRSGPGKPPEPAGPGEPPASPPPAPGPAPPPAQPVKSIILGRSRTGDFGPLSDDLLTGKIFHFLRGQVEQTAEHLLVVVSHRFRRPLHSSGALRELGHGSVLVDPPVQRIVQ